MNKKILYYTLTIINTIILLLVIFYDQSSYLLATGIVLIVLFIVLTFLVESDPAKFKRLKIGRYVFEYIGFEALLLGLIGLYSMLSLTKGVDILWIYYLMFNMAIVCSFRLKLVSIDGQK